MSSTSTLTSRIYIIAIIAVFIFACYIVWISKYNYNGISASKLQDNHKFIVMIDAGSSGSRIHVYKYIDTKPLPTFDLKSNTEKVKPGLSSFESNPEDAAKSIKDLLIVAQNYVPKEVWAITPIYLYATAGLRTLTAGTAEEILDVVRNVLEKSAFLFESHWAKIIPGRDEGMYGWIAANYLSGTLTHGSIESTMGVLEMGGASMQVSFVPHDLTTVDPDDLVTVNLGSSLKFQLYTHSYLNYGLEQAQNLLLKYPQPDGSDSSTNPCYPKGYSFENLPGKGDYGVCKRWVSNLVDKSTNSKAKNNKCTLPKKSCTFSGVYQPTIGQEKFYAIENFFYTSEFYQAEHSDTFLDVLRNGGEKFCSSEWDTLRVNHPKESLTDLSKYCFSAAYIESVLKDGLGISDPHSNVKILKKVKGASVDWSLGCVLYSVANKQADSSMCPA